MTSSIDADARDRHAPASAPRPSASAPGRSAAGCGAAPTRPRRSPRSGPSIDAGVSLIDTAPAYGMGRSEEIVGKAIAGRRDEVVLATKCGLVWHTDKGNHFFDQDGKPVHRYLGRELDRPRDRREPAPPRHRPHRPLHHPLAGPDDADRRDDGRARGPEARRQDPGDRREQRQRRGPGGLCRRRHARRDPGAVQHGAPRHRDGAGAALPAPRRLDPELLVAGARAADRQDRPGARVRGRRPAHRRPALQRREPDARRWPSPTRCGRSPRRMAPPSPSWSSPGRCASPASPSRSAGRAIRIRRGRTRAPARSSSTRSISTASTRRPRVTSRDMHA